ncbi:sensor histidine kinase [Umezawaea beigongshangensis]|uniref:sensor histidine kinase n=1 Tax=Umezawaea beigongshangensis TaxID=2780383 RepID=UPI0027DAB721|nr:histidine kinase [Umezawaea beigongshangensis]
MGTDGATDPVRGTRRSLVGQSLLVAATCAVVDVASFVLSEPAPFGWREQVLVVLILAVDGALATSARRSGLVAGAHALLLVAASLLLGPGGQQVNDAGVLIAAYRAGAWLGGAQAATSALAMAVGLVVNELELEGGREPGPWPVVLDVAASCLLPLLVGRYTTARGAYIAELEQRSERQQHAERAAVARAVAQERSAVARDLHDVISHHVSAIGVHAGAARLGLGEDTDGPARRALHAVERASRSAMADLRRLLALLHGHEDRADRQPGLAGVDELVQGVRAAGLPVALTTRGGRRELPGSVDVALHRIVQETLTNALRHGGGGLVEVDVHVRERDVVLTVTNEMPNRAATNRAATNRTATNSAATNRTATSGAHRNTGTPRLGLAGIGDRVALFDGEFRHGPDATGEHWVVRALLPTGERP